MEIVIGFLSTLVMLIVMGALLFVISIIGSVRFGMPVVLVTDLLLPYARLHWRWIFGAALWASCAMALIPAVVGLTQGAQETATPSAASQASPTPVASADNDIAVLHEALGQCKVLTIQTVGFNENAVDSFFDACMAGKGYRRPNVAMCYPPGSGTSGPGFSYVTDRNDLGSNGVDGCYERDS